MRILIFAAAIVVMLGIGMAAGSLLTGRAQADNPPAAAQANPATNSLVDDATVSGNPVYVTPGAYPQYSIPPRLQVIVVPSPDGTGAVTLLLDNQTGQTYVLRQERTTPSGFRWTFLTRI